MIYSDLTDEQRERVAYLFADTAFQTDPACFDYEVNRDGEIVGRHCLVETDQAKLKGGHRSKDIQLLARPEPHPTTDMIRRADLSLDEWMDSIARRVMSHQQEVIIVDP